MTTTPALYALTKTDTSALRAANDGISFHTGPDGSVIRAYHRADRNGPWATERATYEIQADARWTCYRGPHTNGPNGFTRAFASINSSQFNELWTTAAGLLRPGDRLRLHWIADNNSETLDNAGLHSDELRLEVIRGEKSNPALTFHIQYGINPGNSARMMS